MYQVTKMISFSYGHRLLNYDGKCKYLHGHNGIAEITLETEKLDERGIAVDFSEIKNVVGKFIWENMDHKMLLKKGDPVIEQLKKINEPYYLMEESPTAENIAKMIFNFTKEKGFPVISVKLWETESSFAIYSEVRK